MSELTVGRLYNLLYFCEKPYVESVSDLNFVLLSHLEAPARK